MKDNEVLVVENLSKKFIVKDTIARQDSILDKLKKTGSFTGMGAEERIKNNDFWALKDINFKLNRGDTLGIVGVNGAGKTTLLKIITEILEPTTGTITMKGRLASLIGVGTGFHLELSGRENIYFNAALLGMTKAEVNEKMDEIVDFCELGDFVDSPMKYYSTGMRARLGFSIAMNLDAEVMIIDEALAVGDARFKKKSTQKMRDTAFTGRTVLFVSHQSSMIEEVCNKTLWLEGGKMVDFGDTKDIVARYNEKLFDTKPKNKHEIKAAKKKDERIVIKSASFLKNGEKNKDDVCIVYRDEDVLEVELMCKVKEDLTDGAIGISFKNHRGGRLFRTFEKIHKKGDYTLKTTVPFNYLANGKYEVIPDADIKDEPWIVDPRLSKNDLALTFMVGGDRDDKWDHKKEGLIKPPNTEWKIEKNK